LQAVGFDPLDEEPGGDVENHEMPTRRREIEFRPGEGFRQEQAALE